MGPPTRRVVLAGVACLLGGCSGVANDDGAPSASRSATPTPTTALFDVINEDDAAHDVRFAVLDGEETLFERTFHAEAGASERLTHPLARRGTLRIRLVLDGSYEDAFSWAACPEGEYLRFDIVGPRTVERTTRRHTVVPPPDC